MRKIIAEQLPLVPIPVAHHHAAELKEMSRVLDVHPEAAGLVLTDLIAGGIDPNKGRAGLSGEQVLRIVIIKQMNNFSYEELAFHVADSMCYRAFCRVGMGAAAPSASALQYNIKKVSAETLETINRMLVTYAAKEGIENGKKVRTDCTVMNSNIHAPTDSSLLWDCVRVLTRYVGKAQACVTVPFTDHTQRAKRRYIGIMNAKKMADRVPLYRDLIKVTKKTRCAAKRVVDAFQAAYSPEAMKTLKTMELDTLYAILVHYVDLTGRVLDQTRRRVLLGESVPASEKVVSIFEPHTDIIIKDRRETLYGHKLCLTAGASGLVLDCVIETGNPADSKLAIEMIERQIEIYGRAPRQACFDGGFSSIRNVAGIKALKVEDVAFSKSPGIAITDMVKSSWVYKKLKHFRAGIESIISFLKRCFGWSRCTWRSFASFRAYTWSSVVAANLLTIARHALN